MVGFVLFLVVITGRVGRAHMRDDAVRRYLETLKSIHPDPVLTERIREVERQLQRESDLEAMVVRAELAAENCQRLAAEARESAHIAQGYADLVERRPRGLSWSERWDLFKVGWWNGCRG